MEAWQWPTSISTPTMPTDAYKVYGKTGTLHIETIGGAHDHSTLQQHGASQLISPFND